MRFVFSILVAVAISTAGCSRQSETDDPGPSAPASSTVETQVDAVLGEELGCEMLCQTQVAEDPNSSDEAYCRLFAARMQECMRNTEERTMDEEIARCVGGRATARAIGRWDDEERAALVRCLRIPDCDGVGECMRQEP